MTVTNERWIPAESLDAYGRLSEEQGVSTFELDDPTTVWYVEEGAVDVFSVEVEHETVATPYRHVLRAGTGSLVFGTEQPPASSMRLRAKGLPGFSVRSIPAAEVFDGRLGDGSAQRIDAWISSFTESIVRELEVVPFPDRRIEAGGEFWVGVGSVVSTRGEVVWLPTHDLTMFLGTIGTGSSMSGLVPLTRQSWVLWGSEETSHGHTTNDVLEQGRAADSLRDFHRIALEATLEIRLLGLADAALLQMDRTALRRKEEEEARLDLKNLAATETAREARGSEVFEALKPIGARERIRFVEPAGRKREMNDAERLRGILLASDVRAREVQLPDKEPWWYGDNGALLGFSKGDRTPIALTPSRWGRYRMLNSRTGQRSRIDRGKAGQLESSAWAFYGPLPKRPVTTRDVRRMLASGAGTGLARFLATGLVLGLISFAPAVVLGLVSDRIVPAEDIDLLNFVIVSLLLLALVGGVVQLVQSATLLCIEGRATTRITAALWDRLISLRIRDLESHPAGDLATRAMVFMQLREAVSGTVASALTSFVFLVPALALLTMYEKTLAMIVAGIGLLILAILVVFGVLQFEWHGRRLEARRRLIGSLYEFINAVGKIQKAGAIGSVFAAWAARYRAQKHAEIRIGQLNEFLIAVSSGAPLMAAACLLGFVALGVTPDMSTGRFLTVYAASMVFFAALARLGSSLASLTAVVPSYGQIAPLLALTPESGQEDAIGRSATGDIVGDLRLDQVSFRYDKEGPLVLDDVSIRVRPGEFVAIVGESGSGKSTVFNLLLGLETPTYGAVYYDDENLKSYNLQALRQRVGVVAQDSSLMPGSILQNIVGVGGGLSVEDAWRAAEQARVDEDIRSMPMGMYTSVGDHATLFSGGQAQRILIAAALVRQPRILFLDEATNWLDNESQAMVVESIGRIAATRVVIAHRLTTIRNADRIYVMSAGRIVQEGTFDDLRRTSGKFQELIARQTH